MGFFSSDTYSKSYLFGLGQRWGINAETGYLIENGIQVQSHGDENYSMGVNVDFRKMEFEKDKLTRSVNKHLR